MKFPRNETSNGKWERVTQKRQVGKRRRLERGKKEDRGWKIIPMWHHNYFVYPASMFIGDGRPNGGWRGTRRHLERSIFDHFRRQLYAIPSRLMRPSSDARQTSPTRPTSRVFESSKCRLLSLRLHRREMTLRGSPQTEASAPHRFQINWYGNADQTKLYLLPILIESSPWLYFDYNPSHELQINKILNDFSISTWNFCETLL